MLPKVKEGDLILTGPNIIGFEDEGFENQLCIMRRMEKIEDRHGARAMRYFATTLADGREVELFYDEFTVAKKEHTDGDIS